VKDCGGGFRLPADGRFCPVIHHSPAVISHFLYFIKKQRNNQYENEKKTARK
jgi:hypothetical protein